MDAVKFIEERNRMCESFCDGCTGCPAYNACDDKLCVCAVGQETTLDATAQIAIVEKWSAEHQRKTRQDVFLERWPNAELDSNGVIVIDPCDINKTIYREDNGCYNNKCDDCRREFWMKEVEQ